MKKGMTSMVLCLFWWHLYAPPNCEIYKHNPDCYASCQEAMKAITYSQGSYPSQQHFIKSIELCPGFAYSYMEKAVPFLKRGLFIEWKTMIDKAVELAPVDYLGYRGWCRIQFLRDFEGAIKDIEHLKSLIPYDIGYCQTGDYHLNIALALCYKETGYPEKARELFIEHLQSEKTRPGLYDYYHFGILEYEAGNYDDALSYFDKQIAKNDYMGETYYFKALAYKKLNLNEQYAQNLEMAENYYRKGKIRTDTYTEPIDKIYLTDILAEKETVSNSSDNTVHQK